MRTLGLVLAVSALVAAGCGGETREEATTPLATTEAAPPADTADAAKRPRAPAIEGVSLDGERISLADYRGRPVFVNVWSSW